MPTPVVIHKLDNAGRHALVTGEGTGSGLRITWAPVEASTKVTITGQGIEVLELE